MHGFWRAIAHFDARDVGFSAHGTAKKSDSNYVRRGCTSEWSQIGGRDKCNAKLCQCQRSRTRLNFCHFFGRVLVIIRGKIGIMKLTCTKIQCIKVYLFLAFCMLQNYRNPCIKPCVRPMQSFSLKQVLPGPSGCVLSSGMKFGRRKCFLEKPWKKLLVAILRGSCHVTLRNACAGWYLKYQR